MRVKRESVNLKNIDIKTKEERSLINKIEQIKSVMFIQLLATVLTLLCSLAYMIVYSAYSTIFIIGQIICLISSILIICRLQYDDLDMLDVISCFSTFIGLLLISIHGLLCSSMNEVTYDSYITLLTLSIILCTICLLASPCGCKCSIFSNIFNIIQNIFIFPIIYVVINGLYILSYDYMHNNIHFMCFGLLYMFSILFFANFIRLVKFIKINFGSR